jgi:hypothetical protein
MSHWQRSKEFAIKSPRDPTSHPCLCGNQPVMLPGQMRVSPSARRPSSAIGRARDSADGTA